VPIEQGTTSQIDHVVLSPYGIFVIETKNMRGWIAGKEASYQWTQTFYRRKSKFLNPILQNLGHIKAIDHLLARDFGDNIPYISIIAFPDQAVLKVDVTHEVTHFSNLLPVIGTYRQTYLDLDAVLKIDDQLLAANIEGRAARKQHVAVIKQKLAARQQQIAAGHCPNCGKQLVKRSGKYGEFLGCTGFPSCRFKETSPPQRQ